MLTSCHDLMILQSDIIHCCIREIRTDDTH